MSELAADLRLAVRGLRRAPLFALASVLVLALAIGAALPLLGLARSSLAGPAWWTDQAAPGLAEDHARAAEEVEALLVPERIDLGRMARIPELTPGEFGPGARQTETVRSVARVQGEAMRALVAVLLACTAVLALVAASNLASLALARATARRQETAMRVVLGAPRARLVRQLAAESALVIGIGVAAGLALAAGGAALLEATWPGGAPPWATLRPGWPIGAAVLGGLAGAVLAAALAPARLAARRDAGAALSPASRATPGPREGWQRRVLVVAQVAVTMTLLTAGGLLMRGFAPTAAHEGPGYDPRDTLTVQVDLAAARYADPDARLVFQRAVLEGIAKVPGVAAAGASSAGAWVGLGTTDDVLALGMAPFPNPPSVVDDVRHHLVSPGHFAALGIPVQKGRTFGPGDGEDGAPVAVVSESFAHVMLPGVDPLGKKVRVGGEKGTWYTVVGVVGNVRAPGVGTPAQVVPEVYLSSLQHPPRTLALAVRARPGGDPLALRDGVAAAILEADAGVRPYGWMTMQERLARFALPLLWFGRVFGALAAVALVLSLVGLAGVVAHQVQRRTREVGVRMALGARAGQVVRMVVGQAGRLTFRGVLFGLWGSLSVARLLQFVFLGVDPFDAVVFGTIALALGVVVLAASGIPARRAATVDPAVALRAE